VGTFPQLGTDELIDIGIGHAELGRIMREAFVSDGPGGAGGQLRVTERRIGHPLLEYAGKICRTCIVRGRFCDLRHDPLPRRIPEAIPLALFVRVRAPVVHHPGGSLPGGGGVLQ
jgi:hypothetical protein